METLKILGGIPIAESSTLHEDCILCNMTVTREVPPLSEDALSTSNLSPKTSPHSPILKSHAVNRCAERFAPARDPRRFGPVHLLLIYSPLFACFSQSMFLLSPALSLTPNLNRLPVNTIKVAAVCTIQGWGITFFLLAAMFWTACLSIQCLLAIQRGTKLDKIERLEKWFHIVSWGIPFILATTLLFIGTPGNPVYTDATLWCWIGAAYQEYRFYFFYLWLWAIFLFNLGVYGYVGFTLWSTQRRLARFEKAGGDEAWQPSRSMRIYVRKTSFFIVAFFINWFWGSLNRIQNMSDPTNPIYALFLLHSIFTPLQGFLNFVAYFLVHFLFKASNGQQQDTTDTTTKDSKPSYAMSNLNNNNQMHYSQDPAGFVSDRPAYSTQTLGGSMGPDYSSALSKGQSTAPSSSNFGYGGASEVAPYTPRTVYEPGPVGGTNFGGGFNNGYGNGGYQPATSNYAQQGAGNAISPITPSMTTPNYSGATPNYSGATPNYSGATPNYSGAANFNYGGRS
ncbi:hypothetical protein HK096_003759 [Nowakowskiella sp. JEL0078]|nr:hypothetical protein HK096_003759 [Nowakowskiella sp. JEL0078]